MLPNWFYGFKPRLVMNDKGEIISFAITPGNVSCRCYGWITCLLAQLEGDA